MSQPIKQGIMKLNIKVGRFVMECSFTSLYLSVPGIGYAFIGEGMTCFDSWDEL